MNTVVITPPAKPLLTLEDTKAFLRVEDSGSDGLIQTMIAAATGLIDGPYGWLGRALVTQTLEVTRNSFYDDFDSDGCGWVGFELPYGPIQSVTTIKYNDTVGAEQTFDAGSYQLSGNVVSLLSGGTWPTIAREPGAVRVRYIAGFGDPSAVPAPIRSASLLLVGHLFANREAVSEAQPFEMPLAFEALLSPFRAVYV